MILQFNSGPKTVQISTINVLDRHDAHVVSPGDVVHGGVGLDLALEEHVVPQVDVVPLEISPESNFRSGSDCNINI